MAITTPFFVSIISTKKEKEVFKVNERVVLITGCSSGVGRSLCNELMEKGYRVVASARKLKSIEDLQVDMSVELDVTDNKSIAYAINMIVEKFGHLDILVNNAGYSVRSAIEEMNMDETKNMFDVNVYGVLRMIQAVVPYMREQHSGKIMNIGSISGKLTGLINGGYCASKHAVEAITEAARYELREYGIQVTVVEPGAMETEFFYKLSINSDKRMNNEISPYFHLYQRDLKYRKNQNRANVEESVKQISKIINKKKWKVRYTISLSFIYSLLIRLPDNLKENLILKFN